MEKKDMNDLWKLLAVYRRDDPHLKDSTLKAAWFLVLEPFQRDDVRAAVGSYFREKRFWPDVTEIALKCPPLPVREDVERNRRISDDVARMRRLVEEIKANEEAEMQEKLEAAP